MRRRMFTILLLLSVLLSMLPGASAAEAACFVGVNDTIPMYLPADQAPYYKNSVLYIPYTVFNVSPGGVTASYNAGNESLALFTRAKRLVYDLQAGTVTDEAQKVGKYEAVYRNGLLYIPASRAISHFGLSYTMLTSNTGSSVLRITDGSQKLDNTTFIKKAETLISIILDQERSQSGNNTQQTDTENNEEPTGPATVYLAFTGEAVSEETLKVLKDQEIFAAFFLTLQQMRDNRELVREIYAAGHRIGLAAEVGQSDISMALEQANQELDRIIFQKSFMVLSADTAQIIDQYVPYRYKGTQPTVEEVLANSEEAQLLVCGANAAFIVQRLRQAGAYLPQLLENTQIPGITS